MSRKYIVLSSAAGVVVLATVVAILQRRPTLQLASAEVTRGSITREVLTTGTLEPEKAVDAGTQVSGTVQALEADFNSRVRAGEVIARLDPSIYDSQVAQAQAEVTEADADATRLAVAENDARVKLGRAETLARDDLIPKTDLENARLTHDQAVADLRAQKATAVAARAALKQAQVNRSHTVIHSPIDGVVVNRSVEVGQTLAASVQSPVLFTIADWKRMSLLADIDQSEVGEIKAGTHVTFQVESLGPRTFDATVAELRLTPNVEEAASPSGTASPTSTTPTGAAAARGSSSSPTASTGTAQSSTTAVGTTGLTTSNGPGVITYTAVIAVPNPDSVLAPGTTATITLPVGTRTNAIRIPNNALTFRPSTEVFEALKQTPPQLEVEKEKDPVAGRLGYVWTYDNGRFRAIKVRTGLADEQWTELLSGEVAVGQRLVTSAGVR
jgi:HlyD family secretion protein